MPVFLTSMQDRDGSLEKFSFQIMSKINRYWERSGFGNQVSTPALWSWPCGSTFVTSGTVKEGSRHDVHYTC